MAKHSHCLLFCSQIYSLDRAWWGSLFLLPSIGWCDSIRGWGLLRWLISMTGMRYWLLVLLLCFLQEWVSPDTGNGNCQFLKSWAWKLAQHHFCCILLGRQLRSPDSRGVDMDTSLDGRHARKMWGPRPKTRIAGQNELLLC